MSLPLETAEGLRAAARLNDEQYAALRAGIATCREAAQRSGAARALVLRVRIPSFDALAIYRAAPGEERFYWEHPQSGRAVVGRGRVAALEAVDAAGLEAASARARDLFEGLTIVGDAAPASAGPLLMGAFAFSPELSANANANSNADERSEWQGFLSESLVLPEQAWIRGPVGWDGGDLAGDGSAEGAEGIEGIDGRSAEAWWCLARSIPPDCDADEVAREIAARFEQAGGASLGSVAPERQEVTGEGSGEALLTTPPEPGVEFRVVADRSHDRYRAQVRAALDAVQAGSLEKVVLARSIEVIHPGRFDVPGFLERLRVIFPSCVTFALSRASFAGPLSADGSAGPVEESFVAASPERLVSLEGAEVRTAALAGSAARGRSPEEDEELGRELRECKKNQAEHAAVVWAVRDSLAELCGPLAGPEAPELLRIEGIQHLSTPLRGQLRGDRDTTATVLDLVDCLHPTPAVCGLPREAAREWLERFEGLDRGGYAGPVGFVDAAGGGEFWVGLRSGLIRNAAPDVVPPVSRARLYAGAGIVAGSDADAELRETRLKLRALLAPLTEI